GRRVARRDRRARRGHLPVRRGDPQTGAAAVRRRDAHHLRRLLVRPGPERRLARRRARAGLARRPVRDRGPPPGARGVRLAHDRGGGGLMVVWRWTKAVALFLVDYVVGDDWTVAALIVLGL